MHNSQLMTSNLDTYPTPAIGAGLLSVPSQTYFNNIKNFKCPMPFITEHNLSFSVQKLNTLGRRLPYKWAAINADYG